MCDVTVHILAHELLYVFSIYSGDEVLNNVSNTQVRDWLAKTFTRTEGLQPQPRSSFLAKERFKAVANTIMIGRYFEK